VALIYYHQDRIVSEILSKANLDFRGKVELSGSHISFIHDFPFISIDLEHFKVYESKIDTALPIIELADVFVGFDLFTILSGKMEIQKINLEHGKIDVVQYSDDTFNIMNAFATTDTSLNAEEEFHLHLEKIELTDVDVSKTNVQNDLLVDIYFSKAYSSFKTISEELNAGLDAKFELSVIKGGDTTFIHHKHFEFETIIHFNNISQRLTIEPTSAKLEGAVFDLSGYVDFNHDMDVNLKFAGNKPNFDLFLAMSPVEVSNSLKSFENRGQIFFEATVQGGLLHGNSPAINARFGCQQGFFRNTAEDKALQNLAFSGYFTNGSSRNPSTMEFGITDFSVKPEAGIFSGMLVVKNFESPEINLQLNSDFDLNFLARFFNLKDLYNLTGNVKLVTNFHDIIDLRRPEASLEHFKDSYLTELKIENLTFQGLSELPPLNDLDMHLVMNGHDARLNYFNLQIGRSDLHLEGSVSDLPAILHHSKVPVTTSIKIKSDLWDLAEITHADSAHVIDEQIQQFEMALHFNALGSAFLEANPFPVGEFFIDDLHARLTHYPHSLRDFHADVIIDEDDIRLKDFSGLVDRSDFHFSGVAKEYKKWFQEKWMGDSQLVFDLTSERLQLEDLFTYKGENYVPVDYRHEEFDKLKLHGLVNLHFQDSLKSLDLNLSDFSAKMKLHKLRMENFRGRIHLEGEQLTIENFSGAMGHSDIQLGLSYFLGNVQHQHVTNQIRIMSNRLDLDELLASDDFTATAKGTDVAAVTVNPHDNAFNIYELPFSDMNVSVTVNHLSYHRYLLHNLSAQIRTQKNHYLYLDDVRFHAADGVWNIKGYFNGSDPRRIYFKPEINVDHVDLDKLLFKFENFGQDHIVSENIHGKLTGKITGQILMHTDLTPIIDQSEMHMDLKVYEGRLENYALLHSMSEYFADENLDKVRFDTLQNHLDWVNGVLTIPNMTINSTLGFMEISGSQSIDTKMDYFIKVPWKMITQAASSKLFGSRRKEDVSESEDEIERASDNKRTRYVNIRILGDFNNYKVTLEKPRNAVKSKS
jgi:hypothetical protein